MNFYAKVPTEWVRHKRPASLPLVGKAVIHIGDEGKFGSVKASFYPGNPPINYHSKRLTSLKKSAMILRLQKSQEQRQMPTQHFMQVQQVNLTLSDITKIGLQYGAKAVLTNHAVQSDNVAKKTVLLSQAGNLPYILCREKIVIF